MEQWRKDLYLSHHGILGQKWGHQNGPPYPLDASDHSASEKKAGWKKSLDKEFKKRGKQMSRDLNNLDQDMSYHKRHLIESNKAIDRLNKKASKKELSDKQKDKLKEATKTKKEATKAIEKGTKEVNKIINNAEKSGYTVKSRECMRNVAEGRDILPMALRSAAMTAIATVALAPTVGFTATIIDTGPRIQGTRYKVKKNKD